MSLEVLGAFGGCAWVLFFRGEPIKRLHAKTSCKGFIQRLHPKASSKGFIQRLHPRGSSESLGSNALFQGQQAEELKDPKNPKSPKNPRVLGS
jgi:hypothetical protein